MLSMKLLLGLTLVVLGVAYAEGIVCPPDFCDNVDCEEPQGCKGGIVTGGFCGCCQVCAKVEDESCGSFLRGVYALECDTGLECRQGDGVISKCKPVKK